MRVAIMQPYFLPYIGYYQLIATVDLFIVYDNIKYTKKGWINRNRLLCNGEDAVFSLPLKKDSDSLDVIQRELAGEFNRRKLLDQFKGAYVRAPYFKQTFSLLERIISNPQQNLFEFVHYSIMETCAFLGIGTEIKKSSEIDADHSLKGEEKVIALCRAAQADVYINSIGGMELYSKAEFGLHGLNLQFLRPKPFTYVQFGQCFVPWLSIVDVLMFNAIDVVRDCIMTNYELI